ncbi:MXAN_5453 family MXYO-CTERM-anchored protein, partial [Myxococcus sp. 1LA]
MLGAFLLAGAASAELPDYTFQLQARTNLAVNTAEGSYNVELGSLLPGSFSIPITADRQVGFQLSITPEGRPGMWYGQDGEGGRIYLLPDGLGPDARVGEVSLNSHRQMVFAVAATNDASKNGIYVLNAAAPNDPVQIVRSPLGSSNWSSLVINEAGQMSARVTLSTGYAYTLYTPNATGGFDAKILAAERNVDPTYPYTFLYSPGMNDQGQMAAAVDLQAPDSAWYQELRIFNPDGTSQAIADTRGYNPASNIFRFAAVQPAINNLGQVAIQATMLDAGGRRIVAILLWDGNEMKVVAQDGMAIPGEPGEAIGSVEAFPPDINDRGHVVFRATRKSDGFRAVWVGDGVDLKRVVTEHDILPSDNGDARVDQETTSNPVFAGTPNINRDGDISFGVGLAPPETDQVEWGTAVYIAQSSLWTPEGPDAGTDAGTDTDAGTEPEPDAGTEPEPDAGTESEPDAG